VILVSEIVGFALPIILLPMVLAFWKHHDVAGIDARRIARIREHVSRHGESELACFDQNGHGYRAGKGDRCECSGAGLLCVQPLSPTGVIHMTLETPGHPIEVETEVVRCDTRHRAKHEEPHHGIGVFFRGISDDDRAFLAALVEASISETASENIQERRC